jgi:hypothetical protein
VVPLELLHREKGETLAFPEHNFIILTNRCQKFACKFCLFFGGKYLVSGDGRCVSKSAQLQKIIDGKSGSVESMQNFEAV